jgi:hypothetical protein
MRIRSIFLAVIAFALVGCWGRTTLDASGVDAYDQSLNALNSQLSPGDRTRLQNALFALAMRDITSAEKQHRSAAEVFVAITGTSFNSYDGPRPLGAPPSASPDVFLRRTLGPIDGLTGMNIIERGEMELSARVGNIMDLDAQIDEIKRALTISFEPYIGDLRGAVASEKAKLDAAYDRVYKIANATMFRRDDNFCGLAFDIANKGQGDIADIEFMASVQEADKPLDGWWGFLRYSFSAQGERLPPGEATHLALLPLEDHLRCAWQQPQVTINITRVLDPDKKSLIDFNSDELNRRSRALDLALDASKSMDTRLLQIKRLLQGQQI